MYFLLSLENIHLIQLLSVSLGVFFLVTLLLKSYSFLGLIGYFKITKRFAYISEFFSPRHDTVRIVIFI